MTDPLRAEIERLARECEQEASRRRKDAARPGEPPSSRRMLECGAAFELSHAALLRAALRSTAPSARSPEPEGGGHSPGCRRYLCEQGMWCPEQHRRHASPSPATDPEPLTVEDYNEHAKALAPAPARPPENGAPAHEEAATLPKRALRPLTGDALKDACRRLSPQPALEDMDLAGREGAATGTREPKEATDA